MNHLSRPLPNAKTLQSHEQTESWTVTQKSQIQTFLCAKYALFSRLSLPSRRVKMDRKNKNEKQKKVQVHVHASNALTHSLFLGEKAKAKKNKWEKNELETSWFMLQKEKKKSLVVTWCGLVYGMMRRITSSALRPVRYLSIEITTWMVYMSYICLL